MFSIGSTSIEAPPASPVDIVIRLEKIRSNHEDIEKLEQMVMEDLKREETSPMELLRQGYRLQSMAKSIILKTQKLVETYETKIGVTYDIAQLRDQSLSSISVSSAFSTCLQKVLEHHRKFPSAPYVDSEALHQEVPVIAFTEEECFGRYLDLHDLHNQYINSSFGERVDYSAYLDVFSQPEKIPPKLKLSRQYTEYMEALLRYLTCFIQRTQPLQDPDLTLSKVEADLEEQYGDGNELIPSQLAVTHLDHYSTVEELIDVEPERLTEALVALGLNTGGTQQQRARRLSLTNHARLQRKHLLMEAKVKKLCNLLDETIEKTKQNRGNNRVLAIEEAQREDNQLKRSMGWDGKPIPYWLDKLGLGQEYECEICENDSYAGKKAFERHFEEWRHKGGLRSLGIPYTEKMIGMASIEEAKEIWMGMTKRPRLLPRPPFDRSQLMDQGTKGSGSNQAPAGVAIPPPDIRNVVGKTVAILSETRLEIERKIIDVFGKVAGFEFLNSGDEYHPFYLQRLAERRARATSVSDGAGAATRSGHGDSQTCPTAEFTVPPPHLEPHKFTCRVPEGITGKELDIIKLAAQFWALYGRSFWEEHCSESRNNDAEFEFMKKPGGGSFGIFSRLVQAYTQVVVYSRPGFLKEKLRENPNSDMETVLENCFHRLQMDRFSKERWEERAREERARAEKSAKWVPRGAQLLGHMCEMGRMALDPPPKPDPKRQKIDESELVPEDQFLAQQPPGCAKIWIYLPCDSGGEHFKIKMPSLSEKVASLKEKIVRWVGVPASQQKLSGKSGILEDNKSLAHYNVGAQDVLTLIVEWRKLPVVR